MISFLVIDILVEEEEEEEESEKAESLFKANAVN